jgi:hypothetical protein
MAMRGGQALRQFLTAGGQSAAQAFFQCPELGSELGAEIFGFEDRAKLDFGAVQRRENRQVGRWKPGGDAVTSVLRLSNAGD